MHIVQLHQLGMNYAGRQIFQDLNWAISDRARIGLVGPNGAGKSTLVRLIAGLISPESGQIIIEKRLRVGYLPQDPQISAALTLIEAALLLPPELQQIETELSAIEQRLADPLVYEDAARLSQVLDEQDGILRRYEALNGPRYASEVRKNLAILGFTEADYALDPASLSGGQKKLLALARLAAAVPGLLLLDEPDNHLDLQAKRALEHFISAYPGAVVLISHDRYLLDECVRHIAELAQGRLTQYSGNYSAYVTERELQRLRQQQQYVAQQKEIARIEAAIARFELWASMVVDERHIRQARSRRKMLDKMEANGEIIERVRADARLRVDLQGSRGSTIALEVRDLAMAFDDELLFEKLSFSLRHGERVGLIGANGAGKSVLFRLILGEYQPFMGTLRTGPSTTVGYYSQEHQTLESWLDRSPLDMIQRLRGCGEGPAVSFLLKMLFRYEQVRQPIRTLSGGERSRLQIAALVIQQPNLLLLDEPTNNLDIASVEALEEALNEFEGTILTISHDRYFLDKVVDEVMLLEAGRLRRFAGGYTDYLVETGQL